MMNLPIKRSREDIQYDNLNTIAKCLMLLSNNTSGFESTINRVFECKTCNREFPSFQALGGHRASHKKPKLGGEDLTLHQTISIPTKPKSHECSICGLEFAIGQALGGHMRRHRAAMMNGNHDKILAIPGHGSSGSVLVDPVVKKSQSGKRVWSLDLNLTPMENDLEFRLGKIGAGVEY